MLDFVRRQFTTTFLTGMLDLSLRRFGLKGLQFGLEGLSGGIFASSKGQLHETNTLFHKLVGFRAGYEFG